MSKIRTTLVRRATAAIVVTLIAAPGFAQARFQPLVMTLDKPAVITTLLNRETARPAPRVDLAMNTVTSCTRTGPRMVC